MKQRNGRDMVNLTIRNHTETKRQSGVLTLKLRKLLVTHESSGWLNALAPLNISCAHTSCQGREW